MKRKLVFTMNMKNIIQNKNNAKKRMIMNIIKYIREIQVMTSSIWNRKVQR